MLRIQLAQIAKLNNAVTDLASKMENLSDRNNDGIWAKWRNWRATRSAENLKPILDEMVLSTRYEKYPSEQLGAALKIVGELQDKFEKMDKLGGFERTRTFCRKDPSNTRDKLDEVLTSLQYLKAMHPDPAFGSELLPSTAEKLASFQSLKAMHSDPAFGAELSPEVLASLQDMHPETDSESEPEMSPSPVNTALWLEARQPVLIPVRSSDGQIIAYKMGYEAASINGPSAEKAKAKQQTNVPDKSQQRKQPDIKTPLLPPAVGSYSWGASAEAATAARRAVRDRKQAKYDES